MNVPATVMVTWAAVATAAVLGLSGAAASQQPRALEPRCFGAAARDPLKPCHNPALDDTVVPKPSQAEALPNGPCTRLGFQVGGQKVCQFGDERAPTTVVLIGDSHSTHWRAGVDVMAKARGWRALQFGHTSCPLNLAVRVLPEPLSSSCKRWKPGVLDWMRGHPEVHTVFVSELSGGSSVVPAHGRSAYETSVRGYLAAWRALPPSVQHIVVIRDSPKANRDTIACVERAIRDHRNADRECPLIRSQVLDPDPAVTAAHRTRGGRVRVVDLTRFFCDRRRCHAVIGGVLVHQDLTHMTATFDETLGPYLLRAVDRLLPRGGQ